MSDSRWVIQLTETGNPRNGLFVAQRGSESSYTNSLRRAQIFNTAEDARDAACGNETPVPLSALIP
jgi:hypothetical protein